MAELGNTIAQLQSQLRQGELTAKQAWQAQCERFALGQRQTHAAIESWPVPEPTFDAHAPLSCVGLAHKDIFDLPGRAPGLGRDRGHAQAQRRLTPVIDQLAHAGGLNFGALALAEDACAATGQTRHLPTPINPLDAELAVGGSSSGSSVAVACGMVYASLGTDTAGSVRMPAMTCGVMGLKTTHTLLKRTGMAALSPSLDGIGVLARSTLDVRALMQVLAPQLPWCAPAASRLAFWLDGTELTDSIYEVVAPVMRHYASLHIDCSAHEARASALQELIMAHEVGLAHQQRIAQGLACQQVSGLGTFGLSIPPLWWHEALAQRSHHLDQMIKQVFAQADVLLLPLQVEPLPKAKTVYLGQDDFETSKLLALHRYCGWINYLGLPALAIPIGCDQLGHPVSIQLVGKPFSEPQLLAVGRQIEQDIHGQYGIEPILKL